MLLVGNEMMRASNISYLLHALMQSAGWGGEGDTDADAVHDDPNHPSLVYEHYHDGYSLGPNPFSDGFDPAAYEAFDATQTELDAAAAVNLNDTESRADLPERSRIPLANLLRPSPQRSRVNAAWKAQSDADLGAVRPQLDHALKHPFALASYRLMFPEESTIATEPTTPGKSPRKQIDWVPYDTEQIDARGFHGQPVAGAGVGIFTGQVGSGSLLLNPVNTSTTSSQPAPANSKRVWPSLFPDTFALNLWVKIDELPAVPTAGAFAGAILDCRPAVVDSGATQAQREDGSVIQLRIVVTEAGAAPRMQFRYTNADGTAEQTAYSPAAASPSDPNALLRNKWEMWSVTFQSQDAPSSLQLFRNGLVVGENNMTSNAERKFVPWFADEERLFKVPQVARVCKLGENGSPDTASGGGSFFKGRMADLALWSSHSQHPDTIKKIYLEFRPANIKLDRAPRGVGPIVMGGTAPPEEGSAAAASFRSPVRPTPLSHAFCPGTLKLFNRTHTPLEWGTVVLGDHVLSPFIPWWFRHSLLPGLEILTSAILAHSPRARILVLEGWAPGAEALSRDMELKSLQHYFASKIAAAASGAPTDAAQDAANREIFASLSDSWTPQDVRKRIQGNYRRAQQYLLVDAANYAYDYGLQRVDPVDASNVRESDLPFAGLTLLTASNFEVLPVLGAWDALATKAALAVPDPDGATPSSAAANRGWGKRPEEFFLVPAKDPPMSPNPTPLDVDNLELGRVATPSGLGAFVIATQLFTAITLRDASMSCGPASGSDDDEPPVVCSKGFCPCTLAPLPLVAPNAPTFATQLVDQRVLSRTRCALVRMSSAEAFTASFPPAGSSDRSHAISTTFEWQAGPADAEHALCNLPLPASSASASAASSTGAAADEEMGIPTNLNPGPEAGDYNNGGGAGTEEAGVGEEPSLGQRSTRRRACCCLFIFGIRVSCLFRCFFGFCVVCSSCVDRGGASVPGIAGRGCVVLLPSQPTALAAGGLARLRRQRQTAVRHGGKQCACTRCHPESISRRSTIVCCRRGWTVICCTLSLLDLFVDDHNLRSIYFRTSLG